MSEQLKWADVAHMYTKNESCIILEIDGVGKRELLWQQGTRGVMYATSAHALHSRWSQHKPILRHLKDMTEAEAKEFYSIRTGLHDQYINRIIFRGKPANVVESEYLRRYKHGHLLIVDMTGKVTCVGSPYAPNEWVWLYKNGFDIHGLIESGEAIRREVENG